MKNKINVAKRKEALEILNNFKNIKCNNFMVKICNIHLKNINKIFNKRIFYKNDCYVDSQTLWEIMQPIGNIGHHHSHGLSSEQVLNVLLNLKSPYEIRESYDERFVIITLVFENSGYNLCAIVQPNMINNVLETKINKLITIHPIKIKM